MYTSTLLTTLFASLAMSFTIPSPHLLDTRQDRGCGIVNSTVNNGESTTRLSTRLPVSVCTTITGVPYYYRVDTGCSCNFYT
jgi:hypothetical protein